MNKSNIQTILFHFFAAYGAVNFFSNICFSIGKALTREEETFWERHPFEDNLEKADDLCEIGYTFQKSLKRVGLQKC